MPRVREDAVAAAFIMRGVMITGATEKGKYLNQWSKWQRYCSQSVRMREEVFFLGWKGAKRALDTKSILLCVVDDSGSGARVTSGRSAADFPLYFEAI